MYLRNIGFNHCHDSDFFIDRPKGSEDNLFIILKTPAIFQFSDIDTVCRGNAFVLYTEGTPQRYRVFDSQFKNDWIHFKLEDNDMEWFNKLNIPTNQIVYINDIHSLSILINSLSYEAYNNDEITHEYINLSLKLFFIKLAKQLKPVEPALTDNHWTNLSIVRSKIYQYPYREWNIEGLAHELTMSRSNFQHLYKACFGISPINDVINSRILLAKAMLQDTTTSIHEIAELCGYRHETHFMRQFKKITAMTPTDYRNSFTNMGPTPQ